MRAAASSRDVRARSAAIAAALLLLGALALVASALLAWWSRAHERAPRWVALVDTSTSVARRHPDAAPRMRAELERWLDEAAEARADVELWVVGPGAERRAGPAQASTVRAYVAQPLALAAPTGGADGTPLALALARIEAADPARAAVRLHWIGDASCTGRDPRAELARARARGATCTAFWLGPPSVGDVGFVECRVLEPWTAGTPVRVQGSVGALLATRAAVRVEVELALEDGAARSSAAPLARATRVLELGDGAELAFDAELDAGASTGRDERLDSGAALTLRARVRRLGAESARASAAAGARDAFPENDTAVLAVRDAARPLVVCVGFDPQEPPIAAANAELALRSRDDFPRGAEWRDVDLVISRGAPRASEAAAELWSWIRGGGVWWQVGALAAAQTQGIAHAALRDALPLEPARAALPRGVRLLVDTSGSMQGAPFELLRAAALELVQRAAPDDRIELCFFAAEPEPVRVLREADGGAARAGVTRSSRDAAADALRSWLAARVPQGATHLLDAVAAALDEPPERRAELVFVFSDGRDANASPGGVARARELALSAHARGVALVAVACGATPDIELLSALAGGAPPVASAAADQLAAALLERALDGRAVQPLEHASSADFSGALARVAWPAGLPARVAAPAGGRRAHVDARASADVWLRADMAPLGALQRVGGGWIAELAWEPAAGSAWPREWMAAIAAGLSRVRAREHVRAYVDAERIELRGDAAPARQARPAELRLEWSALGDEARRARSVLAFDPLRDAWVGAAPPEWAEAAADTVWVAELVGRDELEAPPGARAEPGAAPAVASGPTAGSPSGAPADAPRRVAWFRQPWPIEARLPVRAVPWASAASNSPSAPAALAEPHAHETDPLHWPLRLGLAALALLALGAALALGVARAEKKIQVPAPARR